MAFVAGFGLLVFAVWRSVLWVDIGDSTCGPLYRPDIWLDDWCFQRTAPRLVVAIASLCGGVGLIAASAVALLRESREGGDWLDALPPDDATTTEVR